MYINSASAAHYSPLLDIGHINSGLCYSNVSIVMDVIYEYGINMEVYLRTNSL
jgi:hypothetical protein